MNNNVIDFYTNHFMEESRLKENCDNRHKIELQVKQKILLNLIGDKTNILDVSAGTGVYSIFLSKTGKTVRACDLVDRNIKVLTKNAEKENLYIECKVCDARKLDYKNCSFDVVLLGGAIYHLSRKEDKIIAITEAKRVLKPNGILIIDYLSKMHGFIQRMLKFEGFIENVSISEIDNLDCKDDLFSYNTLKEMKDMIFKSGLIFENAFGTDGITRFVKDKINNMNSNDLDKWIQLIYNQSNNENIIDLSEHCLIVCKK